MSECFGKWGGARADVHNVFVVAYISARDGERAEIPLSVASQNQWSDKQNLLQELLLELSAIARLNFWLYCLDVVADILVRFCLYVARLLV
jgi:hypothetical protein